MLTLGLDVGIASIGWMVLDRPRGTIVDAGVYCFETPETRDGESNRKRHGGMERHKRQLARRRRRMTHVRRLLHAVGAVPDAGRHAIGEAARRIASAGHSPSPWRLRAEGLHRRLSPDEWVVVIGHMVGHRAYSSNAKQNRNISTEPDNEKKKQLGKVREALQTNDKEFVSASQHGLVTTVGEWLSKNDRQRNRAGDYRFTIRREWVVQEARTLFSRQRARGNPASEKSLEDAIVHEIVHQEAIKSKPVFKCTFEPSQDRAARHSYSFELFRLLARLNNLKIVSDLGEPPSKLTEEQIAVAVSDFGMGETTTYRKLKKKLHLKDTQRFDGVPDEAAEKKDVFGRKSVKTGPGVSALRKVVIEYGGETDWFSLLANRHTLDGIAAAIAHHDDLKEIELRLSALDLDSRLVQGLLKEADEGELGFFKGTGHLSSKALRKLEPFLRAGFDYHYVQIKAGYDPSKDRYSRKPGIEGTGPAALRAWLSKPQLEELITSQTAARAVRETFKQVLAIVRVHPNINAIHIEMARDVGKSADARKEIENDQRTRANRRNNLRCQFADTFGRDPSESEAERWALLKEQLCKCPFTPSPDDHIECSWILDGDGRVQIEHILPRSRFRNDSMSNKVLCLTKANQNKRNQTPYEWLSPGGGLMSWEQFGDKARAMFKGKQHEPKLKNLLIVDVTRLEQNFKNRDLVDTRWIAKFLLAGLNRLSREDSPIKVQPVNAGLVGMLRHAWGLDAWKRDPSDRTKRRADDRHHALDAAVVACIDGALVQRLTHAYQKAERLRQEFPARRFEAPWKNFRRDILDFIYGVGASDAGPELFETADDQGRFVIRSESRRARGSLHKENPFAVRRNGRGKEVAVERIALEDLLPKHLPKIRYGKDEIGLRTKLETWLARDKSDKLWPTMSYTNEKTREREEKRIRYLTVQSDHRPAIRIETGDDRKPATPKPSVAREGIVRVDLFMDSEGQHLCRPIYRIDLSRKDPPNTYLTTHGEDQLPHEAEFVMSIYKFNYLRVVRHDGTSIEGYYRFFDRPERRFEIWPHYTLAISTRRRVSVGTIQFIEKLALGRMNLIRDRNDQAVSVRREPRTWRPPKKPKN